MIKINKSPLIVNFGIALSLVGVPIGMYLNYIFPFVKWSPVIMFISIICILSFKNLILGKLPSYNKTFKIILLFQLLMLLYGSFSSNLTFQYLTFHFYIVVLLLALSSIERSYSPYGVIHVTFYVSIFCSILGAFFLWSGIVTGEKAWLLKQENDEYALEPFTVAMGAIVNLVAALCYKSNNTKIIILQWLFILIDIYIVFISGKRTPLFVSLIIILVYVQKTGGISTKVFIKYLKLFLLFFVFFIVTYFYFDSFQILIDRYFLNFYNGVLNILGNTDVKDLSGSGIDRYTNREFAYSYISNNFNFFNYILGAGYMTKWIDNPLLQSFLDMGMIGFILYVYLVIFYPIKSFFKIKNMISLFAFLLCVYNIMATYSSGNPYAYLKHVPIVFLSFILFLEKSHKKKSKRIE